MRDFYEKSEFWQSFSKNRNFKTSHDRASPKNLEFQIFSVSKHFLISANLAESESNIISSFNLYCIIPSICIILAFEL